MLMNLNFADDNPPNFYQINFGLEISDTDVISLELKTWRYLRPLGIPYGPSLNDPRQNYPGFIRDYGFALTYQRFIWEDAFLAIHAMNALQEYNDPNGVVIQRGYMLFITSRAGYQFSFFGDRFFIEPSIAATWWPIRTNVPREFQIAEEGWNRFFLAEPGLHFGFRF
jgi:hypothetical protein